MLIEEKHSEVFFMDLSVGDTFSYCGDHYMKIHSFVTDNGVGLAMINSVKIRTGIVKGFGNRQLVRKTDGKYIVD